VCFRPVHRPGHPQAGLKIETTKCAGPGINTNFMVNFLIKGKEILPTAAANKIKKYQYFTIIVWLHIASALLR